MQLKSVVPFLAVLTLGGNIANGTPLLEIDNGILVGASGLEVDGLIYDLTFVDGTCIGLFGGCDEGGDFVFGSADEALAASQALIDFVFLDLPEGAFDSDPRLTSGCIEGSGFIDVCDVWTPYDTDAEVMYFARLSNWIGPSTSLSVDDKAVDVDTTSSISTTWAQWTLASAVEIPEPHPLALMTLGFLAMRLGTRRVLRYAE